MLIRIPHLVILALLSSVVLAQEQPTKKYDNTAQTRLQTAARKVSSIRRRIQDEEKRRRELVRNIEEANAAIKKADTSIEKYSQQVEQAKAAHAQADTQVEDLEKQGLAAKQESDSAKAAAEASKQKVLDEHRQTPEWVALDEARQAAEKGREQAEAACLEKLMKRTDFAQLHTTMVSAQQSLEQKRASGERDAIAKASVAAMEAQNKHNVAREKGLNEDPAVAAAREKLKAAQQAANGSLGKVEAAWAAQGEGKALTSTLAEKEKTTVDLTRRKTDAEQARASAEKQAKKAASELSQRQKAKENIETQGKAMQRETETLEDRIKELEADLRVAESELAAAQAAAGR